MVSRKYPPIEFAQSLLARVRVLEARVPYGYEQEIVQEASLSVAATGSMAAAGSAVTITLPAGWTSMAVKVTCVAQWSQTAGAVSLYLCRVLLDSAQTMPSTRVTVTNDRAVTTTQTSEPVAAGTGYTADVTCQFQQQLPVGNATLTQLDFLIEKFRTG